MTHSYASTNRPEHFEPMPVTRTQAGHERRFGCEIELIGVDEEAVAQVLQTALGGTIEVEDAHLIHVRDTSIADVKIELDTALPTGTGTLASRAVTGLLAKVVPAEIVTAPLSFEQVVTLSNALKTLEQDGAKGSQDGALYGFGVHLNAEVTGIDDPFTLRTIRAFAVLDPFLRHAFPVDLTRRILPFIKAWPDAFTRQLVENRPGNMAHIMELAAHHTPSRNYALDLFPLFKEADPRAFEVAFPDDTATKPRPSFHFRLPDSRMGERGWSLLEAWNMWRLIERVAHDPRTLEALQKQWLQDHDNGQSRQTEEAAARTDALLKAHLS